LPSTRPEAKDQVQVQVQVSRMGALVCVITRFRARRFCAVGKGVFPATIEFIVDPLEVAVGKQPLHSGPWPLLAAAEAMLPL
jgi:hypothetical protein